MKNAVKDFNGFINDDKDILKLKDIISTPKELEDIFDICKNEISLSNKDISTIQIYVKIYIDCLMQFKNLTHGHVDVISDVRNLIKKSLDTNGVRRQYKQITNPSHILSATLLKMITDYKDLNFVDEKLQSFDVKDVMRTLVMNIFVDVENYSTWFKKRLLNANIKVN